MLLPSTKLAKPPPVPEDLVDLRLPHKDSEPTRTYSRRGAAPRGLQNGARFLWFCFKVQVLLRGAKPGYLKHDEYSELITYKTAVRAGDRGFRLVVQEWLSETHLKTCPLGARSAAIRKVENPLNLLTGTFSSGPGNGCLPPLLHFPLSIHDASGWSLKNRYRKTDISRTALAPEKPVAL